MNNKSNNISFRFLKFSLIPALFLLICFSLYAAEKQEKKPRTCFGIGGSFSHYDVHHKYGEYPEWDGDFAYGGGIIFESMLTDTFGIHSGIWYSRMELTLISPEDHSEEEEEVIVKQKIESDILTIPLYLITSFGPRSFTFNLLTGLNLSTFINSQMSSEEGKSENIKKYLGTLQFGIGGGLEIIMRATRFTGFFVSGIAEYYLTDLVSEVTDTTDSLFDFQVRAGFLLFTF
ncbi:MAG: outer membrane beta-barrel protein [Spirochaetes bacterium]|nr:outer membrane beta-barrel protein [Spirochaetota bacterium]